MIKADPQIWRAWPILNLPNGNQLHKTHWLLEYKVRKWVDYPLPYLFHSHIHHWQLPGASPEPFCIFSLYSGSRRLNYKGHIHMFLCPLVSLWVWVMCTTSKRQHGWRRLWDHHGLALPRLRIKQPLWFQVKINLPSSHILWSTGDTSSCFYCLLWFLSAYCFPIRNPFAK